MKIVLNMCYGGFSLSREAVLLGREISGDPNWGVQCIKGDIVDPNSTINHDYGDIMDVERKDPVLIQVVEQLGSEKASGIGAKLKVVDIPKGTLYRIEECDGYECYYYKPAWKVAD